MLTLERLNALRGISSNASKSGVQDSNTEAKKSLDAGEKQTQEVSQQTQQSANNLQANYSEPVEIPCKNYVDEKGHFAYIDAKTQQISHVNLEDGKVYKMDDVYRLSLQHVLSALSPSYHQLKWQQVLNDETVYDRFGSPVFSFSEVQKAYKTYVEPTLEKNTQDNGDKVKTDAFGLPIR